ncbi:MAG: PEP-CTERM sorting domain-containing protein [Pirellulales bacterium]|nr:PEP-CTERM sorting domain-containing protein [Pirellulales bacterium]
MTAGSITMYTQPFYVGYAATGNGTVDQSGGTITAINLLVGRAGVADYDMSGGAITVAENAWIAARSAAQGIFSLSGDADVQITGNLNVCPAVGDDGNAPTGASGTLNIVGESVTITVGGNLVATGATVTDPEEIWVNESLFNFTTGATDDVSTISVTGTADIDGAVFDIIETGSAGDGTILDLISTGGGISNFATATVGPTATGIWALQLGGASDEILQAVKLSSAHIPGDATGNGIVDDEDAQRLATNWGTNGSEIGWSQGDFDGDNIVGPKDASIMAANWGFGTGGEASAVPEPSTLVLMLGTLCLLLARRRSR